MSNFLLEIAAFSLEGALAAQNAGAHRIELCENPAAGVTTPSFGSLTIARRILDIPVFPIIRPRPGDFCYSSNEFEVMKADVLLCKKLGFEGVVLGILNVDGTIDKIRTAYFVDMAYPMDVTFHRAFDRCIQPKAALLDVIETGCTRLLTSGQFPTAIKGAELIRDLIETAQERIIVMPGGGIRKTNIAELAQKTRATEFHSGARKSAPASMIFEVPTMAEKNEHVGVDTNEIAGMLRALN